MFSATILFQLFRRASTTTNRGFYNLKTQDISKICSHPCSTKASGVCSSPQGHPTTITITSLSSPMRASSSQCRSIYSTSNNHTTWTPTHLSPMFINRTRRSSTCRCSSKCSQCGTLARSSQTIYITTSLCSFSPESPLLCTLMHHRRRRYRGITQTKIQAPGSTTVSQSRHSAST